MALAIKNREEFEAAIEELKSMRTSDPTVFRDKDRADKLIRQAENYLKRLNKNNEARRASINAIYEIEGYSSGVLVFRGCYESAETEYLTMCDDSGWYWVALNTKGDILTGSDFFVDIMEWKNRHGTTSRLSEYDTDVLDTDWTDLDHKNI